MCWCSGAQCSVKNSIHASRCMINDSMHLPRHCTDYICDLAGGEREGKVGKRYRGREVSK